MKAFTSLFFAILLFSGLLISAHGGEQTIEEPDERVRELVGRFATQEGKKLTPEELRELESLVAELGYDDVLAAMDALEQPEDVILETPTITPGEPRIDAEEDWEEPARILADRLLDIAPRHTSRWVQIGGMGMRGSVAFIDRFAKTLPELAWEETKHHYAEYWERLDGGKNHPIPPLANGIFCAFEEMDENPGRGFLLDGSYEEEPYSSVLQRDAQMGMLCGAATTQALMDFLNWKLGPAKNLADEMTNHRFNIDPGPIWRITPLALALLAQKDPEKAIDWAEQNKGQLDFEWLYQIFSGWYEFWPEKPGDIEVYETRRADAFRWLALRAGEESPAIHNAYFRWRNDAPDESRNWLQRKSNSKKLKAVKEFIKEKDYQTQPTKR